MKKQMGQSLIEVVFSIGLIAVVVSGVVFLLVQSLGAKSKSYERKKAVELSQNVIEGMVESKSADATSFWNLNSIYWLDMGQNHVSGDYNYRVTPSQVSGLGCSPTVVECINATVTVGWGSNQTMSSSNRFFSKK
ncbi:MAG: hypothetical protein WAV41_03675 [Microgenomates group bacterium]